MSFIDGTITCIYNKLTQSPCMEVVLSINSQNPGFQAQNPGQYNFHTRVYKIQYANINT